MRSFIFGRPFLLTLGLLITPPGAFADFRKQLDCAFYLQAKSPHQPLAISHDVIVAPGTSSRIQFYTRKMAYYIDYSQLPSVPSPFNPNVRVYKVDVSLPGGNNFFLDFYVDPKSEHNPVHINMQTIIRRGHNQSVYTMVRPRENLDKESTHRLNALLMKEIESVKAQYDKAVSNGEITSSNQKNFERKYIDGLKECQSVDALRPAAEQELKKFQRTPPSSPPQRQPQRQRVPIQNGGRARV